MFFLLVVLPTPFRPFGYFAGVVAERGLTEEAHVSAVWIIGIDAGRLINKDPEPAILALDQGVLE